jgi:hypothetical protein
VVCERVNVDIPVSSFNVCFELRCDLELPTSVDKNQRLNGASSFSYDDIFYRLLLKSLVHDTRTSSTDTRQPEWKRRRVVQHGRGSSTLV